MFVSRPFSEKYVRLDGKQGKKDMHFENYNSLLDHINRSILTVEQKTMNFNAYIHLMTISIPCRKGLFDLLVHSLSK